MSNNIDSLANAGYECPICAEQIELEVFSGKSKIYGRTEHYDLELCKLRCRHVFHLACIKACEEREQGCPKCRKSIEYTDSTLTPVAKNTNQVVQGKMKSEGVSGTRNAHENGGDVKQNGSTSVVAHAMASSSAPTSASAPSLALAKPLARQESHKKDEEAAAQSSSAPSAPTLAEIEGASHSAQSSVATHNSFSLAQETASARNEPVAASASNMQQVNMNNNQQTNSLYCSSNESFIWGRDGSQVIYARQWGSDPDALYIQAAGCGAVISRRFATVKMGP